METQKRKKTASTDMTKGNPYKLIVAFSIPLLIGNVLQQLYNMVDSIVVGNIVGEKALAAVGTGFPVIFMLTSLFMGIGIGATIMLSQYFGAKDFESLQDTVSTINTGLIIGIIPLTLLGMLCSKPLLMLMKVPDDGTLDMAVTYMVVIFAGVIGMLGYNINAGILQGLGDSKTSLKFLAVATVINIVLDLLFTWGLRMGVAGVALATIIAQISSWLFGIYYINKHYDFIHIRLFKFHFNKHLFSKALKLGIPSGIQQALFSVGIMTMQTLVNGYGSNFIAGFNGANKIDSFAFMPIMSFNTAITTYVGQNIGAGRIDRVKAGIRATVIISIATCVVIGWGIFPFSEEIMKIFNQNPEVVEAGVMYLRTVLPFYPILAVSMIYSSALRGAGEMIIPLISSFVGLWLARIPTAYLFNYLYGKETIFYSYTVGWVLGAIIVLIYYRTGKWKNKSIVAPHEIRS